MFVNKFECSCNIVQAIAPNGVVCVCVHAGEKDHKMLLYFRS